MNSQKAKTIQPEISIIGCGIAGLTTAFHLGQKGYKINLIDPEVNSKINNINPKNGTQAALGVLMGNIYKRSKGRAFFLRNRSMKLWKEWLIQINFSGSNINIEKPLIKLANSKQEYQSMLEIYKNKKELGIQVLDKVSIEFWNSIFEKKLIGGLISYEDGRLDPIKLTQSLMQSLDKIKVNKIEDSVIRIKKNINSIYKNWTIDLKNNESITQDYIVICSALNTQKLLRPLGHSLLLNPILGQVIELEIENTAINLNNWPAILNYQSINFINHKTNRILIGATIESGSKPNLLNRMEMLNMDNTAPQWLRKAKICHEWHGIRARPSNQAAPILKELEPGLLVNSGHYRNGILLAPSCAEWVGLQIKS